MEIGFLAPAFNPSNSFKSAIGYTPPPPTVLSFPVTEPTKVILGSLALTISGMSFEIIRKCDK